MRLEFHRGDRNGLLLGALIITLVFAPYVGEHTVMRYVFNALITFVMVLGALSAAETHGRARLVAIGLAVALLGVFLYSFATQGQKPVMVSALEILFLVTVGLSIMGKVLNPGPVTLDKLFGALSVYLLAGLVLGMACEILEMLRPGSFTGAFSQGGATGSDMIYFGFVTLTTLGYGDIAPVTAKARSLAMLGAILGPLYVAVLIARLISDFGEKPSDETRIPTDRL